MAKRRSLTYAEAGVDIRRADRLVSRVKKLAASTLTADVMSGIGPFAAAVRIPKGYTKPLLVSSADGVGTKLAVAQAIGRHNTVGIDLVAMNVNDLLTTGARPLFFLDYVAVGSLETVDVASVVEGIAEGCRQAGMSLVGGETAEMPGFYPDGAYDLAGFAVGICDQDKLIDGRRVRSGDAVVGLESHGLHSNGYSLVRRVVDLSNRQALARKLPGSSSTLGEELLRPTRIYVKPVLAALDRFEISAMAHVTGGGLAGNLGRVIKPGLSANIEKGELPSQPIFDYIEKHGDVSEGEMLSTFNCGTGFVIIVRRKHAEEVCTFMRRRRIGARLIGSIAKGRSRVRYV